MATEKVGIEIEVSTGNLKNSIGSLREEIIKTKREIINLTEEYGKGSKEVEEAQKRLKNLQQGYNEKQLQLRKINEDTAKTLSALTTAYAGLQGALQLTGISAEDSVKQLAKIQSALAIGQSIKEIYDFRNAISNTFSNVAKTAKTAFNAIKSGIGATGIGLFVIALGLIVTNFDEIKKAVLRLFPGLEKLGSFFIKIAQNVTDFIGVTSEAGRQLDALKAKTDRNAEAIQNRIKVLQAQGGKEKEIYQLSKQLADDELKFLREKLKTKGSLTEEELKQFRELKNQKEVLDAAEQKRVNDLANENAKKAEAARLKTIEDEKAARQKLYADEDKATQTRFVQSNFQRTKVFENGILVQKTALDKSIELDTSAAQKSIQNLYAVGDAKKKAAEAEIKLAEAKKDAEIGYAQMALNIVGGLVDQNSVAGKAIAVVQAIINTYQGASKAIAQGGIFGPVAAAATIAAGLVQVRKIVSTKIPSAKGTGSVADTGGGGMTMASAPISPASPIQNTVTQLDQTSINRLGSATSRAYVVESDITNSQEKITRINRAARLG